VTLVHDTNKQKIAELSSTVMLLVRFWGLQVGSWSSFYPTNLLANADVI